MFERIPSALGIHSLDTHYVLGLCSQGLNGTKMMERRGPCLQGSCILIGEAGCRGAPGWLTPPNPLPSSTVSKCPGGRFQGEARLNWALRSEQL